MEPAARRSRDLSALTRTDVLSTLEVADLLGIPRFTVHELARRGDLPVQRLGRRALFLHDWLAAAIAPLDDPDGSSTDRSGADLASGAPR